MSTAALGQLLSTEELHPKILDQVIGPVNRVKQAGQAQREPRRLSAQGVLAAPALASAARPGWLVP